MRIRWLPAVLAVAALAGCAQASQAAAGPPSARSVAHKLGCAVLGPGNHFAADDVSQDLSLRGGMSSPCLGGEVWTFPSAKAEADWMHRAQSAANSPLGSFPEVIEGKLWAVYPGDVSADARWAKLLGGKIVTF